MAEEATVPVEAHPARRFRPGPPVGQHPHPPIATDLHVGKCREDIGGGNVVTHNQIVDQTPVGRVAAPAALDVVVAPRPDIGAADVPVGIGPPQYATLP